MNTATQPLALADALAAMAQSEMDEAGLTGSIPAIARAVQALTPHLPAERRDLWWGELKSCMNSAQAADEGNAPWHDHGVDWDVRVAEALHVLAGDE